MPLGSCFASSLLAVVLAETGGVTVEATQPTYLGVRAGASFRTGDVGDAEPPRVGVAFALLVGHRWTTVAAGRIGLGTQVELAYARHGKHVDFDTVDANGMPTTLNVERLVGIGDFTALAVVDGARGRLRPWAGVGGGLRVGYYAREQLYTPGGPPAGSEGSPTRPVTQAAAGAEVTVSPQLAVGVRGDLFHTLGAPTAAFPTATGGLAPALRDSLLVSLSMSSRF